MRIGIDMDGTIADFVGGAIAKFNKIYDTQLEKTVIQTYDSLSVLYENIPKDKRPDKKRSVYEILCNREFFETLSPLDFAIEGIKRIAKENEIYIITKPLEWEMSTVGKINWLKKHLEGINYHVIMVDYMETKSLIQLDAIIDDDPRVLQSCVANQKAGIPICLRQQWNYEWRNNFPKALSCEDMIEAAALVSNLKSLR